MTGLAATAVACGLVVAVAPTASAEPVVVVDAGLLGVVGSGQGNYPARPLVGSPQTPEGGITGPLYVVPEDATTGCEASDFAGGSVTGKIALVRRSTCSFDVQQANAAAAGAIAVVISNNVDGPLDGTAGNSIPAGTVTKADGDRAAAFDGRTSTLVLRYHVEERNAPTANPDSYTTPQDTPLTVAAPGVLGNDTDPDAGTTLTATGLDTTGTRGTVALGADGGVTYTPPAGFTGTTTFAYTASDGTSTSAPATVTITVTAAPPPANRADLAATLTVPTTARPGTTVPVTLTVRNTGPAAASRVASGIALPDGMTVVDAGGGSVTNNRRSVGFAAATIAAGGEVRYSITVAVAASARGGKTVGGGVISTRTPDPVLGNNYQLRTTTVTR